MRTPVFLLPCLLALAPVAKGEDLLAIYRLALERDPALAVAAAARESALEAVPQAQAAFLPSVNGGAELDYNASKLTYDNPVAALGPINASASGMTYRYPTTTLSLSVTQPVYHREAFVARRQADSRVSQADAEYAAARQDLMLRVGQRYFDVLAAIDNLATARAEKEAVGKQLEQTRQRFQVGLIAITDVHESQASYDSAAAREIAAENQLANAREALREIVGELPRSLSVLMEDSPLISPDPADPERWSETALSQNLKLEATRFQVEVAREQVDLQRSGHWPRVDAVGSLSWADVGGATLAGGQETERAMVGLQVAVPLDVSGAVRSRVRQAEAEYTRARESLEQQRRATALAARSGYLGVVTGASQVKALKQAVVSNQSALEATEAGYQVGTRTVVDVLNAQRLLYAAQRDYFRSRYDYVVSLLKLKQAAGQISEGDLQTVNGWLREKK